ncbi:MAG: hypothetical protein M3527_04470 [Actinomycetota bacterium]|nr:hypothetical protein [Acidimicrobiia bacterium]MDQ3293688.1 hypothetical protein [Actinomycetota bacterium]
MANSPARAEGPGLLPVIAGGVIGAIVLFWLVGIVIGTIVFAVKVATVIALIAGGFWLYNKFSRD